MYTKKQLTEAAFKELTRRKKYASEWVKQRKMTTSQASDYVARQEAIYRIISKAPDDLIYDSQ